MIYLPLLLYVTAFHVTQPQGCMPPVIPFFGKYEPHQTHYNPSDTIYYSCNKGSRAFGSEERNCTTYGTWKQNAPYCSKSLQGISANDKKWNIVLDNNQTSCIKDKTISLSLVYDGSFSEAVVRIYLSMGKVDLFLSIGKNDCDKIEGNKVEFHERKCSFANIQRNTTQNVTITSFGTSDICEVKLFPTKEMECSLLDRKNISIQYEPEPVPKGGFVKYGTAAIHKCSGDYRLIGEHIRYCIDGQWNGPESYCQTTGCKKYKRIKNGVIKYTNMSVHGVAYLNCDSGFDVKDENYAVCLENGTWNNLELECTENKTDNVENKIQIHIIVIVISTSSAILVLLCMFGTVVWYSNKCKQKKCALQEAFYYDYDIKAVSEDTHFYNTIYEEIPQNKHSEVPLPEIPANLVGEYREPLDAKTESVTGDTYTEPNDANKLMNTCPPMRVDDIKVEFKTQRKRKAVTLDEEKLQKILNTDAVNENSKTEKMSYDVNKEFSVQ